MADDDRLKTLEDRLTRLEAVLTQRGPIGGGGGGGVPPGGGVVVDPAPYPGGGPGHYRRPTFVVDPAPWPSHIVDPPPFDFSTLSIAQLESALHGINAERARLDSLETTIKQQLERTKQKGSQG